MPSKSKGIEDVLHKVDKTKRVKRTHRGWLNHYSGSADGRDITEFRQTGKHKEADFSLVTKEEF
jgi:hypothetical protein